MFNMPWLSSEDSAWREAKRRWQRENEENDFPAYTRCCHESKERSKEFLIILKIQNLRI